MCFLAVFLRADKEVFLLFLNSSHFAGLHGVIGSSREGTSRQADEAGIDIEFCLSASVRGRVVAVFISWLTLCSAPALKEGITVTGTTFTWRKSHSVCGTPAAPLPHLQCFSAAPVLTKKINPYCLSFIDISPSLLISNQKYYFGGQKLLCHI